VVFELRGKGQPNPIRLRHGGHIAMLNGHSGQWIGETAAAGAAPVPRNTSS